MLSTVYEVTVSYDYNPISIYYFIHLFFIILPLIGNIQLSLNAINNTIDKQFFLSSAIGVTFLIQLANLIYSSKNINKKLTYGIYLFEIMAELDAILYYYFPPVNTDRDECIFLILLGTIALVILQFVFLYFYCQEKNHKILYRILSSIIDF